MGCTASCGQSCAAETVATIPVLNCRFISISDPNERSRLVDQTSRLRKGTQAPKAEASWEPKCTCRPGVHHGLTHTRQAFASRREVCGDRMSLEKTAADIAMAPHPFPCGEELSSYAVQPKSAEERSNKSLGSSYRLPIKVFRPHAQSASCPHTSGLNVLNEKLHWEYPRRCASCSTSNSNISVLHRNLRPIKTMSSDRRFIPPPRDFFSGLHIGPGTVAQSRLACTSNFNQNVSAFEPQAMHMEKFPQETSHAGIADDFPGFYVCSTECLQSPTLAMQ